jgi:hypothetical protein
MHFDAEIDDEQHSMGLGIHWEADLTDSVAVLVEAAKRNPQIRAVVALASDYFNHEDPITLEKAIANALAANASAGLEISAEEIAAMSAKFKSQSNKKGDA